MAVLRALNETAKVNVRFTLYSEEDIAKIFDEKTLLY